MADTKLSALTELAATPATDDELYIRDVSEAAAAESKRITVANLMAAAAAGAPADAKYVTVQAEGGLSAEVSLGALTSGLLKHTVVAAVSTPATAVVGTDYAIASYGNYAGNDTENRAIPHGLGVAPKFVIIFVSAGSSSRFFFEFGGLNLIFTNTSLNTKVVTAKDATNFYVGQTAGGYDVTANATGTTYYWVAIG